MIYAQIDVTLQTHPRAIAAGFDAMGLWLWGMLYAQHHETDGRLHRAVVLTAWGGRRNVMLAKKLVEVGLWVEDESGDWFIHNYERKNQTSADIRRKRDAIKERQERFRQRACNALQTRQGDALLTRQSNAAYQIRSDQNKADQILRSDSTAADAPVPEPARSEPKPRAKIAKLGTRLPSDWQPSPETVQWAKDNGIADPLRHVPEFRDYWCAVPGARGTKLNWDATYRNRLRDLANRGKAGAAAAVDRPKLEPVEFARKLLGGV
jgi:hypothetical protein